VFFALMMPILLKKPKKPKAPVGSGFKPVVDENGDVWQRTLGQLPPWM
jgi:hypothetical protein